MLPAATALIAVILDKLILIPTRRCDSECSTAARQIALIGGHCNFLIAAVAAAFDRFWTELHLI